MFSRTVKCGGRHLKLDCDFPCDLNIMGVNLVPSCTLSASTSDLVE